MTEPHPADPVDDVPGFVRAAEIALERLAPGSPLRALIYEQFLDFVAETMPRERRVLALGLLGSPDEETRHLGEFLMARATHRPSLPVGHEVTDVPELDLLVLTPKGTELRAVKAALNVPGTPIRIGLDSDLWIWQSNNLNLGLAAIGTDGNVEAAIELHRITSSTRVRAAVLVGMAAGLKGKVKKGDVVVASWVVAYEFVRVTPDKFVDRAKAYQADMSSVHKVAQNTEAYPEWAAGMAAEITSSGHFKRVEPGEPEKLNAKWVPSVKTGVIFAGSRLIEDGSITSMAENINERGLAAEMEGAGFAAACSRQRIPWLVIRGIADYGDQDVPTPSPDASEQTGTTTPSASLSRGPSGGRRAERGKSWQFPSTYVAAAYVRDMIITHRIPLIENSTPHTRR